MAVELRVRDVEEALRLFDSAASDEAPEELVAEYILSQSTDKFFEEQDGGAWSAITSFAIGNWATTHVEIKDDFYSELNGAFLEAYLRINKELLRLYAFAKYGNDDNRNLTQDDLDYFQFRVKVGEGSTETSDNLHELLEKLGSLLIEKMSGKHAVITILGLALIGGTAWGTHAYLEGRKEVRLAQIAVETRKAELEAQQFATKSATEQQSMILNTMRSQNEVSARAAEAALNFQQELLRAASKTGTTVIGDTHLTRSESKELAANKRGRSQTKILEQGMRVVGGNTGSDFQTAIIFEDPITLQQYKINFDDPILSEKNRRRVFAALDKRNVLWVRLSIKEMDGEIKSAELLDLPRAPKNWASRTASQDD